MLAAAQEPAAEPTGTFMTHDSMHVPLTFPLNSVSFELCYCTS